MCAVSILEWLKALGPLVLGVAVLVATEWLKALGPLVLGVAVFVATAWFQRWQLRLTKQKLRFDLYDRRFAIYSAFHELLLALPEKNDDEIKVALRKAEIAQSAAPFLLDDPQIQTYLEQLSEEVRTEIIDNIMFLESVKNDPAMMADRQIAKDASERNLRLGSMKLALPDRHLRELPQQFARFLKLTDFWK
jgi:hypothetical protein